MYVCMYVCMYVGLTVPSKSAVLNALDNNSTPPFILDNFHITMKYLECAQADGSYMITGLIRLSIT